MIGVILLHAQDVSERQRRGPRFLIVQHSHAYVLNVRVRSRSRAPDRC